jgi:septin 7
LIPVIAKADTLTDDEVIAFKRRVLSDIAHHQIQIFEPPRYELDDDETISENREIMSKMPFAIVGSNTAVKTRDGRIVRAREYPWGIIEVDNEEHCDFVKLRQMLIRYETLMFYIWLILSRTHMEELKEKTSDVLYENYRSEKLMSMGVEQDQTVFKEVK